MGDTPQLVGEQLRDMGWIDQVIHIIQLRNIPPDKRRRLHAEMQPPEFQFCFLNLLLLYDSFTCLLLPYSFALEVAHVISQVIPVNGGKHHSRNDWLAVHSECCIDRDLVDYRLRTLPPPSPEDPTIIVTT